MCNHMQVINEDLENIYYQVSKMEKKKWHIIIKLIQPSHLIIEHFKKLE